MNAIFDRGVAVLAEALRNGNTTAQAATDFYLERIAQRDGTLNAFTAVTAEQARAAAVESDRRRQTGQTLGPLDGVPLGVKDNIGVDGLPNTAGIAAYRDAAPAEDAFVTAALRRAGAVILGKLNMPEGALGATTENKLFGRTENPCCAGYTPGGSSGGSGAAVAAGLLPAALGTDTMGSVRVPASYCGVYGIKPSRGLVSLRGVVPLASVYDSVGVLAPAIGDLALVLEAIAGFDRNCPHSTPPPMAWTALSKDKIELPGRHFGIPRQVDDVGVEPAVRAALDHTICVLRDHGAQVSWYTVPDWIPGQARRAALLLCEVETWVFHERARQDNPQGISPAFMAAMTYGGTTSGERLFRAMRLVEIAAYRFMRELAPFDAVLMPTTPQRAFRHVDPIPLNLPDLTSIANFAGLPAVSLPVHFANSPLPASMQLVGRGFGEAFLLDLAGAVDCALRAVSAPYDPGEDRSVNQMSAI